MLVNLDSDIIKSMENEERKYKLTETEVLIQPSEYIDERKFRGISNYETAEGDGGYLDSFNALKYQIDHNYVLYKEQLKSLVTRSNQVDEDVRIAWRTVIIVILVPVILKLVYFLLTPLAICDNFTVAGIFSGICMILNILTLPAAVVFEFFLLPGCTKNLINYITQRKLLNSDEFFKGYREGNDIISFVDEKKFLKNKIAEYDKFYELVALEGLDKKDGNLQGLDSDQMSNEQKMVLEKMREMSIFHEYKATVVQTRKEIGFGWVIIGFGIFMAIAMIIAVFSS